MSQTETNRLSRSPLPAKKHRLINYKLIAVALLLFALGAMPYANSLTAIPADPPKGWFINGSHSQNHDISVDTTVKHSGKASARMKFTADKAEGFGGIMQIFAADDYHGKRVRMSAWLRSEDAESVQLWLRLD